MADDREAVYRTLFFISVDAHILIFIMMDIVIVLGVDGPFLILDVVG